MRVLLAAAIALISTAAPALAQTERGYVMATGGFATSPDGTSGNWLGEAGVRIAPKVLVFGNFGRFQNLQPSEVQTAVDQAVSAVSTADAVTLIGNARVPAWYTDGGVRVEMGGWNHFSPYVLGAAGVARISPASQFTISNGLLPNSTATVGDDVTSDIISAGFYTQPDPSNAFMFTWGGGVDIPIARHVNIDAGYRFSHVAADSPLNAQGMTFGLGYRF